MKEKITNIVRKRIPLSTAMKLIKGKVQNSSPMFSSRFVLVYLLAFMFIVGMIPAGIFGILLGSENFAPDNTGRRSNIRINSVELPNSLQSYAHDQKAGEISAPGKFITPTSSTKTGRNSARGGEFEVKWGDPDDRGSGETQYNLQFSSDGGSSWSNSQASVSSTFNYTLPWKSTTNAMFRVKAVTEHGESVWRYSDCFTIKRIVYSVKNVTLPELTIGENQTLSWDRHTDLDVTSYAIWVQRNGTGSIFNPNDGDYWDYYTHVDQPSSGRVELEIPKIEFNRPGTWRFRVVVAGNDDLHHNVGTNSPVRKIAETEVSVSNATKRYGDSKFTISHSTNSDGNKSFRSSNTNVATIDNSGVVTIQGVGRTTITFNVAKSNNYFAGLDTATLTVRKKNITGNFTASNKVYDGNNSATVTERTLNGVESGDTVSLSGGTATFNDKHVGTEKIVTLTGATLMGTHAGNYNLTSVGTTTANITPRNLTLSNFIANDKTFDGNTSVTGDEFNDNRVSGDNLVFSYNVAFEDKNVGTNKDVNFTNITISGGSDQNNYHLVTTSGTANASISKRNLTLSNFVADNKIYDGTTYVTGHGFDDDMLTGDDLELSYDVNFENRHPGEDKTVHFTNISIIGGDDKDNYYLPAGSSGTTTADIYNLVTLSREIFGSPYYELDILGDGKDGFESSENLISNSDYAAKYERGLIEYNIDGVEGFTYPSGYNILRVNFTENLPEGVKAIEAKLAQNFNQTKENDTYKVSGFVDIVINESGDVYNMAGQSFEIPVKFTSAGTKELTNESLEARYEHKVEPEDADIEGEDTIEVFAVTIEDIEILNDNLDAQVKSLLKFYPDFGASIDFLNLSEYQLKVGETTQTLFQNINGDKLIVNGLDLEIYEIFITGRTSTGDTVGFRVKVPVFDFEADYVEVFKDDEVNQNVDLSGAIDLEIDQSFAVTNMSYSMNFDSSDEKIGQIDENKLELTYKVDEEINPRSERYLTLIYELEDTIITRKNTFEILAMKDLIKLSREFFGSQFYNLDVKNDGGKGFDVNENPVENKRTVAKDEPGRIEYKISPVTTVYKNNQPFTLSFKETLPEGIRAEVSELPQGNGFRDFTQEKDQATDNYVITGEIDIEFINTQGRGYEVGEVEFDIPITYFTSGEKELNNEFEYYYIDDDRNVRIDEDAVVDVFNVEIAKILLEEYLNGQDESIARFTPRFNVTDNDLVDYSMKLDENEFIDLQIDDDGEVTIEELALGDRIIWIKGIVNEETVGFKMELPVFKFTPDQIMHYSGESSRQKVEIEGLQGTLRSSEELEDTIYEGRGDYMNEPYKSSPIIIVTDSAISGSIVEFVDETEFYVNYTLLDTSGFFDNESNMMKIIDPNDDSSDDYYVLKVIYKNGEDGIPVARVEAFALLKFAPEADVN